jgi:hypothetical protein
MCGATALRPQYSVTPAASSALAPCPVDFTLENRFLSILKLTACSTRSSSVPQPPPTGPTCGTPSLSCRSIDRLRHSTRLPGEQIADAYLVWIEGQTAAGGAILVAERGGNFLGFVAGWGEETTNIAETAASNRFGYISDICARLSR